MKIKQLNAKHKKSFGGKRGRTMELMCDDIYLAKLLSAGDKSNNKCDVNNKSQRWKRFARII